MALVSAAVADAESLKVTVAVLPLAEMFRVPEPLIFDQAYVLTPEPLAVAVQVPELPCIKDTDDGLSVTDVIGV